MIALYPFRSCAFLFAVAVVLTAATMCVSPADAAEDAESRPAAGGDADAGEAAEPESESDADVPAGHSYHGEAFNEGPRQAAELLDGMGNVSFPSSADSEEVQAFIDQGVAALHGFWYLEAERFFRQAAKMQPELAIAYWGMAQANANNADRARGFIEKAVELRDKASRREQMYIDAAAKYRKKPEKAENADAKKKRAQQYVDDLEAILFEFPDDIEAKAFLALHLWQARRDLPIPSYLAVDALMTEIFHVNPLHPAHHYRIHLWDSAKAKKALDSAAKCGPALPAVAHMWHMPGHTYSKLNRFDDAVWQQEASARVDHQHMVRFRLLPDEIHNFAHNNEWLVRNLIFLGRVNEALDQSRNLISLPRHPKYNSTTKRGSFQYGRTRLLQTLTEYELWEQLIAEADGVYLEPTDDAGLQDERTAWLIAAHHLTGQKEKAERLARPLNRRRIALESEILDLEEGLDELSEADRKKDKRSESLTKARNKLKEIKRLIARGEAAAAVAAKDADTVKERLRAAGSFDVVLAASWIGRAGDHAEAVSRLEKLISSRPNQVRPLAVLVNHLWQAGRHDDAVKQFEKLQSVAAGADLDTPLLSRLTPVREKASAPEDWRLQSEPPDDLGERPPLDSLGPRYWSPPAAPRWKAVAADGTAIDDDAFQGKPKLVVFYLGFGCLHCVEQLTAIKPKLDEFKELGIEVLAISTESVEELRKGMEAYGEPLPFPLFADPQFEAFKGFRCWDDFEDLALHGTFLIDSDNRIRWHDIGYEPFDKIDFLVGESARLLKVSIEE